MNRARGAVTLPGALDLAPEVLALRPRGLVRAMLRQPLSFWALFAYVFFEYVRPQSIYAWLDILPFARITLLTAVGAMLLEANGKRRWTLVDTGMVAFTLVLLASVLTSFDRAYALANIDLYLSWVLVYLALSTTVNTQTRFVLLLSGWLLWNLKMSLFAFRSWAGIGFAFRDWGVVGAPGWFSNSGEFGIEMCVVFPISLYFALGLRRRVSRPVFLALLVAPFTAVAGVVASASRGALVAVAVIGLWMLLRSRYKVRGLFALAVFAVAFYAAVPPEQKVRLSASGEDQTSQNRIVYWNRGLEIAREYPLLGVGYKNWSPYNAVRWRGDGERLGLPHNIFIECIAELGYLGFAALLLLLGGGFWLNARTRALARSLGERGHLSEQLAWGLDGGLIGYMASGFFVTVLYYPFQWVNLGLTVGLHLSVARAARSARPVDPSLLRPRAGSPAVSGRNSGGG